jgi:hypothetical protein
MIGSDVSVWTTPAHKVDRDGETAKCPRTEIEPLAAGFDDHILDEDNLPTGKF